MANQFETSFVPQQPLLKVEAGVRLRQTFNLSLVVSLGVFFVTLSVAGGAYFYKVKVHETVLGKGQELALAEKEFDIHKIEEYKNLQLTLRAAKDLVDTHTISSVVFDILEERAAQNIGLNSFSLAPTDAGYTVNLTGAAPDYESLYWQVKKWRETKPLIKSVDVNTISLDELTGIVNFTIKADIDSQYLGYARVIAAQKDKKTDDTPTPPTAPVATPVAPSKMITGSSSQP